MRVFVTGATGFIGSALVKQLIGAGHQVLGLCRDAEKAKTLAAAGGEIYLHDLADTAALKVGAAQCDAVVHLAFNHDFSKFVANCEDDRRVITALGESLIGSDKPFIITSGTAIAISPQGEPSREDGAIMSSQHHPRAISEETANAIAAKGVNVSVVRLPQVHDPVRQGLISPMIEMYLAKGVCAYVGEGQNRWPGAHISDVALLYKLALERAEPGAIYHAVGEEGVPMKAIAETIAKRLKLPAKSITQEEAANFFGWLGMFASLDMPASSAQTRATLRWAPKGPGLIEDLENLQVS